MVNNLVSVPRPQYTIDYNNHFYANGFQDLMAMIRYIILLMEQKKFVQSSSQQIADGKRRDHYR